MIFIQSTYMVALSPFFRAVTPLASVMPVKVPPTARLKRMKNLSWK